jgi:hypothetical protein
MQPANIVLPSFFIPNDADDVGKKIAKPGQAAPRAWHS